MPPPLFLIVEGSIGAGKSTMLEQLGRILTMEHKMKTIIIPEPVDVWEATGALAHFYKDTQANGYQFQTFVYSTRVIRINEYVKKYPDADIYLIERSVISDKYLFVKLLQESGGFTPLQTVMYEQWVTMWDGLLPFKAPHGFIYLAPSVDETLRRIQIRGRSGEHVPRDYQEKLHRKHEELFGQLHKPTDPSHPLDLDTVLICQNIPTPVLRLYSDDDYRHNDSHIIFKQIVGFINIIKMYV